MREVIERIGIPSGVFSRTYRPADGVPFSVVMRTSTRTVALLDGDSAEVWSRIYENRGKTQAALSYVCGNESSKHAEEREAIETLREFIHTLGVQGLIELPGSRPDVRRALPADGDSAGRRTEHEISCRVAEHHILYDLVVESTYACNERCIHCYCPSQGGTRELTLGELQELIVQFVALGGLTLQLTGGEFLLRRDAKKLLRWLLGRGVVLSLNSNLTLLDEESVELLRALEPRSVGCSIYSAEPVVHDGVTNLTGSHARSMRGVSQLRRAGVPVVIKMPLMKHTIKGWKAVEQLAGELGCECQFDLQITPRNDGSLDPVALRVRDEVAIEELFRSRLKQLYHHGEVVDLGGDVDKEHVALCGAGAAGLCVAPDGGLHPCIGMRRQLGRFPENSLNSVWKDDHFFREWKAKHLGEIAECRECNNASSCSRCPGAWLLEHGSLREPSEYTCYLARIAERTRAQRTNPCDGL